MSGWYRLLALAVSLAALASCQSLRHRRAEWYPPVVAVPRAADSTTSYTLAMAEGAYDEALQLELDEDATCVDYYFQVATLVWPDVERQLLTSGVAADRSAELYRSSLLKLIGAGQHYGRFDPKRGLAVCIEGNWQTIPCNCFGFAWQPRDFDYLLPAGDYSSRELNHSYCCSGFGVATVAIHYRRPGEQFHRNQQVFPATLVLRPQNPAGMAATGSFAIQLYNPLAISSTLHLGRPVGLTRDLTAPIAYTLSQTRREYLSGFLQPGSTVDRSGLFMLEPYQPGKIPVVFVHGLLSNRFTWANIANEIHADPDLNQRLQLWGFEYDTGAPFLQSAASLRHQLHEIRNYVDPAGLDPALRQIVLVGHSMGGLISKLQVTHSGTMLWDSVCCQPLPSIRTMPETRQRLVESFFFEPSPLVSRVVFMGTPHRGSPLAERPIGRLGSWLIHETESMQQNHDQLVCDNPGIFSDEFARRLPTSVDLLEPDSELLKAMDRLPYSHRVQLHTIAGYGYRSCGMGDSDRVVPLDSSRKPGVVTERLVHAKHQKINRNPEAVQELLCILRTHVHAVALASPGLSGLSPWK